jgi:hypothetical protein
MMWRRLPPTALGCGSGARSIHQQVAHDLSRQRQEVHPVRKIYLGSIYQPKIRLVNQGGRAQRVRSSRLPQALVRQLAELIVHERDQLIAGTLVTRTPAFQERRDLGSQRRHQHLPWRADDGR